MKTSNSNNLKKILAGVLILAGIILFAFKPLKSLLSKAELATQIEHTPLIMPAAYKVYANEDALDGKYNLFKMLVTNEGKTAAKDLTISYEIPGYIDETSLAKIPVLLPGQSYVVSAFPKFNENIVEKTTASRERVNIQIKGSNFETRDEQFSIDIKGRNEYVYTFIPEDEIISVAEFRDNHEILSSFITPEDPIIKYYTQQIQEKVLKGEAASVENKEEEGVRFLTGVYSAHLLSHMVYSGTTGVPEDLGDITSINQSLRLPREVVTGNTGLCIELSLLYASVMLSAGMDPIIFFSPGHAYPGFRMNEKYYAIEATGIGGEGMNSIMEPKEALQDGMKQLQEFMQKTQEGDPQYAFLDVRQAIKNGAVPMELKDDSYLRQKVDEIAKSFNPENIKLPEAPPEQNAPLLVDNNQRTPAPPAPTPNPGTAGLSQYAGPVSFAYPQDWVQVPKNPQQINEVVTVLSNTASNTFVEVYNFNGIFNPEQAVQLVQQNVSHRGGQLQYAHAGQENGFTVFNGQTYFGNAGMNWVAAFKNTSSGLAGIAVGVVDGVATDQNAINTILNTLQ